MYSDRILCESLKAKVMSAEEAASLVKEGMVIGASGFTGMGYPKTMPTAIAKLGTAKNLTLICGASVGDELDGELARSGLMARRYPFQSHKDVRDRVNKGDILYADIHLGHVPRVAKSGKLGKVDVAIVDCCMICENGGLVPTLAAGATPAFVEAADFVIVELNLNHPKELMGFHDIHKGEPDIKSAAHRVGTPYIPCAPSKIAAIVINDMPEKFPVFTDPDETSAKIGELIIDLIQKEQKEGRLNSPITIQSGVGAVANAVLDGLRGCDLGEMEMYTEVLQDGALRLVDEGKINAASSTSLSLSKEMSELFYSKFDFFKERIVLRPQDASNSGALIRRLEIVAMNTAVEADIYGNVNSTHVVGSKIINGIGGSGDFARNGGLSIFMTPSIAKGGAISCIVPFASHIDSTEHDVQILVTEQGLADLRGLAPRERAKVIIEHCAHPDYRPMLRDYFNRACESVGGQTPHILGEALSWHARFAETGSMKG